VKDGSNLCLHEEEGNLGLHEDDSNDEDNDMGEEINHQDGKMFGRV
jgi:hypothetical protein